MAKPFVNALAVLTLITSSNSDGCSTGSSDGVNKANQAKAITRQVFRAPGPVCQ